MILFARSHQKTNEGQAMNLEMRPTGRRRRHTYIALCIAMGAIFLQVPARGAVSPPQSAEKLVLGHLTTKDRVDVLDLKGQHISADFLAELIAHPPNDAHALTLRNATVDGQLSVSNATIKIALTFDSCTFEDGIDLSSDIFMQSFSLTGSVVGELNSGAPANFIGDRFVGSVDISRTHFRNGVDFTGAKIGGSFSANGAQFESTEDPADFSNAAIRQQATFEDMCFGGDVDFSAAELSSLTMSGGSSCGSNSGKPPQINLLLTHATVSDTLTVQNLKLAGIGTQSAEVMGNVSLQNVTPVRLADFTSSRLGNLAIDGFGSWLAVDDSSRPPMLRLDDARFDGLAVCRDVHQAPKGCAGQTAAANAAALLLQLLEKNNASYFTPQQYLELERILQATGDAAGADDVYFRMRQEIRSHQLRDAPARWLIDWLQYVLVGYGRRILWTVVWALAFIVFGMFLFNGHLEPSSENTEESQPGWDTQFWYSVDLLTPMDLGVVKNWKLKPADPRRHYAPLHRLAGWVLIPLIAAAITGIIK